MLYQTDFSATHKYKFGRDNKYELNADINILNLFDQKIVTGYQTSMSAVTMSPSTFGFAETAGENAWLNGQLKSTILTYLAGTSTALNRKNASYTQPNAYQGARNVRFGLRLRF